MRLRLLALFGSILAAMLWVTTRAFNSYWIFDAGPVVWGDAWGRATLFDAYGGFLTFYAWLAWRERTLPRRVFWFFAVMLLGNIAMSSYMISAVLRLPPDATVADLLARKPGR